MEVDEAGDEVVAGAVQHGPGRCGPRGDLAMGNDDVARDDFGMEHDPGIGEDSGSAGQVRIAKQEIVHRFLPHATGAGYLPPVTDLRRSVSPQRIRPVTGEEPQAGTVF